MNDRINILDDTVEGPGSQHTLSVPPIKHDPFLEFSGARAYLGVRGADGDLTSLHPMVSDHYIEYVYVMDQDDNVVFTTNIANEATAKAASFDIPGTATHLTPWSYCNLHGLWKGPTYNVAVGAYMNNHINEVDGAVEGPTSLHAAGAKPIKHDPFLEFSATRTAFLGVRGNDGSTDVLHPMVSDHFIETVWVEDQDGKVIFTANISAASTAKSAAFKIPASATKLIPWSFCNLHGLWQGTPYVVSYEVRAAIVRAGLNLALAEGPTSFHPEPTSLTYHSPFVRFNDTTNDTNYVEVAVHADVGKLHEMIPSHYISLLYVKNQHDAVVAMKDITLSAESKASLRLPYGTGTAKPFAVCNTHGLWQGQSVDTAHLNLTKSEEELDLIELDGIKVDVTEPPLPQAFSGWVDLDSEMRFQASQEGDTVTFNVEAPAPNWFGVAISGDGTMISTNAGSDAVVCVEGNVVQRIWLEEYDVPTQENVAAIQGATCTSVDGKSTMTFSRKLAAENAKQRAIPADGNILLIWAHGDSPIFSFHHENKGVLSYSILSGEAEQAPMNWMDITRLAIFTPTALVLGYVAKMFYSAYPQAWLKSMLFIWYFVYVTMAVAQVLIVYYSPSAMTTITQLFNLGGWCIAMCGVVDSVQLHTIIVSANPSINQKTTNKKFLTILLAAVYPVCLVLWIVLLVSEVDILVFRIISTVLIILEITTFVRILLLIRTKAAKAFNNQRLYFLTTVLCRVGILLGIVLSIAGETRLTVGGIHFVSVLFIAVGMGKVGKETRKEVQKRATMASQMSMGGSKAGSRLVLKSSTGVSQRDLNSRVEPDEPKSQSELLPKSETKSFSKKGKGKVHPKDDFAGVAP
jgi:desulfoferrodoxin-like iron-binding protein